MQNVYDVINDTKIHEFLNLYTDILCRNHGVVRKWWDFQENVPGTAGYQPLRHPREARHNYAQGLLMAVFFDVKGVEKSHLNPQELENNEKNEGSCFFLGTSSLFLTCKLAGTHHLLQESRFCDGFHATVDHFEYPKIAF